MIERDRLLNQSQGPGAAPGGAPDLPDAVPDGVQNLLDGIFSFGGEMGQAFGEFVNGLAQPIGSQSTTIVPPEALSTALDVLVVIA